MNIWAIVPSKPLKRSKSRLSSVLTSQQRENLSREMLSHTLVTLSKAQGIAGTLLVSRDTAALSMARRMGVQTLTESGSPELNASLERATRFVATWKASGVLIVASDIPLLRPDDVEEMLALTNKHPVVVVAPDRRGTGTNAMLVRPPGLFPYRFGENSFARHCSEGESAGARVYIYQSPTVGLDVDIPADLDLYRELLAENSTNESIWHASM